MKLTVGDRVKIDKRFVPMLRGAEGTVQRIYGDQKNLYAVVKFDIPLLGMVYDLNFEVKHLKLLKGRKRNET